MWLIQLYGKMFPDGTGILGFGLCLVVTRCSFLGIEVIDCSMKLTALLYLLLRLRMLWFIHMTLCSDLII